MICIYGVLTIDCLKILQRIVEFNYMAIFMPACQNVETKTQFLISRGSSKWMLTKEVKKV